MGERCTIFDAFPVALSEALPVSERCAIFDAFPVALSETFPVPKRCAIPDALPISERCTIFDAFPVALSATFSVPGSIMGNALLSSNHQQRYEVAQTAAYLAVAVYGS